MEFNVGIFIAQFINFAIIFFLFKKFVGDKLFKLIQEKKQELWKAEHASEVYDNMVREAEQKKEEILAEALHHKENVIQEAKQIAINESTKIITSADKQAEGILSTAKEQAQNMQKEVEEAFIDGVKRTTKLVVNKLINDDTALKNSYIDGLVHEFVGEKNVK